MKTFFIITAFVFSVFSLTVQASVAEVGQNELTLSPTTDAHSLQASLFSLADYGYRTKSASVEYLTYRGGSLRRLESGQSAMVCSQIDSVSGQKSYHCKFQGLQQLATRESNFASVQVNLTLLLRQVVSEQQARSAAVDLPYVRVRQNGNATVYRLEGSNGALECQVFVSGFSACTVETRAR